MRSSRPSSRSPPPPDVVAKDLTTTEGHRSWWVPTAQVGARPGEQARSGSTRKDGGIAASGGGTHVELLHAGFREKTKVYAQLDVDAIYARAFELPGD